MMMKLEIIGFTMESCLSAQEAGADRVELCAGPGEGGTTPSHAFIIAARKALNIDLFVMIRPRGGDFLYSDADFEIMKEEISFCKKAGCDGIVTGILTPEGKVDRRRCKILVDLAYPLGATFHRAFDRTADPVESLEDIIECGFERVLTSGLKPKATDGLAMLHQLVELADQRIIVMPGSGVTAENMIHIAENTGVTELHSSAGISKKSRMKFINESMEESLEYVVADIESIRKMKELLIAYEKKNSSPH